MYGLLDILGDQWDRTLKNCEFYEDEGKATSLINEIGVLRGLYYAIEDLGIDMTEEPSYEKFRHYINIQQKMKEGE